MKENKLIKAIATALGLNVELEQVKLVDGQTILEADTFEAGKEIVVVTPDGNVPVPVGQYELETGQILVVETEGIIKEILDAPAEETEAEPAPAPAEQPAEAMSENETTKVKRTIESIVKETVFSRVEELKAENEALKAELEVALAKVKEVELSANSIPSAKPITHNPENKSTESIMKLGSKKPRSTMDTILEKMYN
jgi:hypothetical protein